jgi:putative transposase
MGRQAPSVILSTHLRNILERLERSRTLPLWLIERIRFVLMSADGKLCVEQAVRAGVDAQRARRWRKRWVEGAGRVHRAVEGGADERTIEKLVWEVLSDNYRSGVPAKFTAEQIAAIIALACEEPSAHGLPVSHWTPEELARKAAEHEIVSNISPRQVGRFLKSGGPSATQIAVLVESETGRPRRVRSAGASRVQRVSRRGGTRSQGNPRC